MTPDEVAVQLQRMQAEARRFIEGFDKRKTFEQFWAEFLAQFGIENPAWHEPGFEAESMAALRELGDALAPFTPSHHGKRDTDVIDLEADT
jgi:hypothetical protein